MPHKSYPVSRRIPTFPTRRQRAESLESCISWCWLFPGEVVSVQSPVILTRRKPDCKKPRILDLLPPPKVNEWQVFPPLSKELRK